MKTFVILILGLVWLYSGAEAQRLHFGTNVVWPGRIIEFNTPFNGRARMEISQLRLSATFARGAFVAPATLTNLLKPCPLLIVSVPSGGSAIAGIRGMT